MRASHFAIAAMLLAVTSVDAGQRASCNLPTQTCLDLMAKELGQRGWAGLELQETPGAERLVVTKVHEQSPAESAGMKVGDVIVAVNGVPYTSANAAAIRKTVGEARVGITVTYTVVRGDSQRPVPLTLAALPRQLMAQRIGDHMLEHVTVYPPKQPNQPLALPPAR